LRGFCFSVHYPFSSSYLTNTMENENE
jgi:hypothetical protein